MDIGFGVENVSNALGRTFGKSVDDCKKLMNGVRFGANDVSSALKTVVNAGKSVEKGVVSKAKKLKSW